MIRNFLYSLLVTFFTVTFISCEDTNGDNFRPDTDAGWVQFEDDEQINFIGGYHTTLEVPVDLRANTNLSGLKVYYTLENISGDISSVIVQDPGFVSFEKGETTAYTKIQVVSDIPVSGFLFNIKLTSTSRDNIDILTDVDTVILTKAVCFKPISIAGTDYVGEVYFLEFDENSEPEYISTITTSLVSTEEGVYTFGNGAWGSDYLPELTGNPALGANTYPAELTINPDGTVVINGTATYTTEGNTGEINPCTGEITYILSQELFDNPFFTKVVIRPAN